MDYFKRIETIVIAIVILTLGIAYGLLKDKTPTNHSVSSSKNQTQVQKSDDKQIDTESRIRYQGIEGKNALELLRAGHLVETQNFAGVGEFVKSIDGIAPDSSSFWAFYINGAQSQVGADSYMTKSTDDIEWKLEKIN